MASLKIGSLLLRTLSKPIANKIKQRAKDHEGFKTTILSTAQFMHRAEMNLRVSLLGESPKHIRPLSESRAIESGANFLSEGFLFAVAATIIIGETYRGRLSESKRRDAVRDSLSQHEDEIGELRERLEEVRGEWKKERERGDELTKIVEEVVVIGLKGGFGEISSDWIRHLRIGDNATKFGTIERVLRDDDEEENSDDERGDIGLGGRILDQIRERPDSRTTTSTASIDALEEGSSRVIDEIKKVKDSALSKKAEGLLSRKGEGETPKRIDEETGSPDATK